MKNKFPTTKEGLKHIYSWSEMARDERVDNLYTKEDLLRKWSIHTRIVKDGDVHVLQVPLKESQVAEDLLSGDVREVITNHKEDYFVFNDDLSYRHDFSPKNDYGLPKKFAHFWFYAFVGIVFALILLFFRFYNV